MELCTRIEYLLVIILSCNKQVEINCYLIVYILFGSVVSSYLLLILLLHTLNIYKNEFLNANQLLKYAKNKAVPVSR